MHFSLYSFRLVELNLDTHAVILYHYKGRLVLQTEYEMQQTDSYITPKRVMNGLVDLSSRHGSRATRKDVNAMAN